MLKWYKEAKHHLYNESGWSYFYHLHHSVKMSWKLLLISFWSLVHGLFPWVWKAKSPLAVIEMYRDIMKKKHIKRLVKEHQLGDTTKSDL